MMNDGCEDGGVMVISGWRDKGGILVVVFDGVKWKGLMMVVNEVDT